MKISSLELQRYKTHILLEGIGTKGQLKLKNAKVLVIGAGGLGCPLLQYLTSAGVGTIGIVDHDVVEHSNLQRQILFTEQDLEKNKSTIAKQKLQLLNPFIQIHDYPFQFTPENAFELINNFDIIADCSDNFQTRYAINQSCVKHEKINVTASVSKFSGHCSVYIPKKGPCYHCLFPQENNEGESCAEGGILGAVTGILGTIQANEIIKIILNIGESLNGKLFQINTLNLNTDIYELERDLNCSVCHDHFIQLDKSTI